MIPPLTLLCSAHIVRWITEANRSTCIIEDREPKGILGAGRPGYHIPGRCTVARDIDAAYERCRERVENMLWVCFLHTAFCMVLTLLQGL